MKREQVTTEQVREWVGIVLVGVLMTAVAVGMLMVGDCSGERETGWQIERTAGSAGNESPHGSAGGAAAGLTGDRSGRIGRPPSAPHNTPGSQGCPGKIETSQ